MNERLTIQDLTDLLATKHGMTKKDAEVFIKDFFSLIEHALETDKNVKIKGLGTFKLIDVDSRESVDVNSGERIQIQGYTKVSFIPDASLRDTINKPFAHFETVILNEKTVLEDTPLDEKGDEEDSESEDLSLEECAQSDICASSEETLVEGSKNLQSGDSNDSPVVGGILEESKETDQLCQPKEEVKTIIDNVVVNSEDAVLVEEASVDLLVEEETEEEEKATVEELDKNGEIPPVVHSTFVETQSMEEIIEQDDGSSPVQEKTYKFYLIAVILVVLLLCGSFIGYIYFPDLLPSWFEKNEPVILQSVNQSTLSNTISVDSIGEKKVDTLVQSNSLSKQTAAQSSEAKKAVKKENDEGIIETMNTSKKIESSKSINQSVVSSKNVSEVEKKKPVTTYSDSATYRIVGTKTKHTIKSGETLTRVSLQYYGTKSMWPYIVKHNKGVIKNPDNVPYGTTIKIPELAKK